MAVRGRREHEAKARSGRAQIRNGKRAAGETAPRPVRPNGKFPTIGEYLIQRLRDYGINDVFGIPGDFVLQFYAMLEKSPIRVVGTRREDCAGYAADGYARVNGMGAVCVTYCVGGLSLANSIAGAYAEKSPVIVISGAPGIDERRSDPLLHHRVRDFNTQREVFEKITVASALLDDPLTAFREIDRCLEAADRFKRPVFLELPRDRVQSRSLYPYHAPEEKPVSDKQALKEAIEDASRLINASQRPVIIVGVEIHRFALQEEVIRLAERNQIPMCATLLGKSVVSERHPLYLGVYEGAMGRESVRRYVEESDCVILLGTFMTDINLGIYTAHLDPAKCIYVTSEKLRIQHHHFHDVLLSDFVKRLAKAELKPGRKAPPTPERPFDTEPFVPKRDTKITMKRLYQRINEMLGDNMVVVADVGDALFAASDLTIHQHTEFLAPAYYTSMGFAMPAAVGVQVANRKLRPIVLVGDGAFQMTCMELSTALYLGFNPVVMVLNNKGYTTERFLEDGPFNDIPLWDYHKLPELFRGGRGFEVRTEEDLDRSLKAALENKESFSLLNIHLEPTDVSPALVRLTKRLAQRL
jgi:indolepyruvate decarboxylase